MARILSAMRRFAAAALAAACIAAPPAIAQTDSPGTDWNAFTHAFDDYVARDGVVGASVLRMRDGRVRARHDIGWADRDLRQRADTNTIYHWASITKTLTAVAIMQLRDRGLLTLDDRVTDYVPELRQVHDPYGSMDDITIRMLLSHSAGFQDPTWPYTQGRPWEPFEPTRWDQLVAMMPYQELRFAPGSRYGYSNPGFIYLARIIEKLTGDPWEAYVEKNLFLPLGMTRSYVRATPYFLEPFRSNSYTVTSAATGETVVANGREFDPGITIPNGGWNAPLGDLVRWIGFLTTGARGDTILAHKSLEEMWHARYLAVEPLEPPPPAAPTDSMGMSFFILWRDGTRFVGHTGTQAGFRSFFYLNPATAGAVIAVLNTRNEARPEESSAGFREIRDRALALIAR